MVDNLLNELPYGDRDGDGLVESLVEGTLVRWRREWQQWKFAFMGYMSAMCADNVAEINKATKSSAPCVLNIMLADEIKRSGVPYSILVQLWKKRALSNL